MLGPRRYFEEVVNIVRIEGEHGICDVVEGGEVTQYLYPLTDLGPVELTREDLERFEQDVRWAAENNAPQAYRRTRWLAARSREVIDDADLPRLERELVALIAEMDAVNGPFVDDVIARYRAALAGVPPDQQLAWWSANRAHWTHHARSIQDVVSEELGPDASRDDTAAWAATLRELQDRIELSRHAGYANDVEGTTAIATNPVLEAAIDATPDDDATWSVYADWLQQQGDPRGELAALDGDAAAALRSRHERYLLGGLPKYTDVVSYTWRRAWLRSARVMTSRAHEEAGISQASLLTTLLALPAARFLESLTLGAASMHEDGVAEAMIDALVASGPRPALRTLAFAIDGEEEMLSWTETGTLERALPLFPNLTSLDLTAGSLSLGVLDLRSLERLRIETCGLRTENLMSIIEGELPSLTTLELWFGEIDALGLAMAVVQTHTHVTDLGLVNTSFTDELAVAIAHHLEHLERLDLSHGTLTDHGARALAHAHAEGRAPRLESIDVSACYLTEEGLAALRDTGLVIDCDHQRELDGERYVDVWE